MKAIYTKYIPASTFRSARIKAYTVDKQRYAVTIPWDYAFDVAELHEVAARAFMRQHMPAHQNEKLTYGDAPNGYVFTFAKSLSPGSVPREEI